MFQLSSVPQASARGEGHMTETTEDDEEPTPTRGQVSVIGELPTMRSTTSALTEANLKSLGSGEDEQAYRKRGLSSASMNSVERAMKTMGYEAEGAAMTSAAVAEAAKTLNGPQPGRRGSAIKAMELQGQAFAPAATEPPRSKSSACSIL